MVFSCEIYFSSPVFILLYKIKSPFFSRENRLVMIDVPYSLFCLMRLWGSQTPNLLTFSNFFRWRSAVDCDVFKLSAKSLVDWHRFCSKIYKVVIIVGRTSCPQFVLVIFPERNFLNRYLSARAFIIPSPYAPNIFFQLSL